MLKIINYPPAQESGFFYVRQVSLCGQAGLELHSCQLGLGQSSCLIIQVLGLQVSRAIFDQFDHCSL